MSDERPYRPPAATDSAADRGSSSKGRPMRWAIGAGAACVVAAAVCALLTIAATAWSYWSISQTSEQPTPEHLADRISIATIFGSAIPPLLLAGFVLLAVGFVFRKPSKRRL